MEKTVVEIEEFVALRNVKLANEAKAFLSKIYDRIRISYDMSIPIYLAKVLDNEQEKFKYINIQM